MIPDQWLPHHREEDGELIGCEEADYGHVFVLDVPEIERLSAS